MLHLLLLSCLYPNTHHDTSQINLSLTDRNNLRLTTADHVILKILIQTTTDDHRRLTIDNPQPTPNVQ